MGNEQSTEIPERICYLFGYPNVLMTYNTRTDAFQFKEIENNILKNMSCLLADDSNVYLSGGISADYSQVSNKVYRYNIEENIFRQLPDMIKPRYTHQMVFLDNKIYALGGRSYGEGSDGILNDCEVYEFGKWKTIASMNKKRATFFSIVFKNKIYAFGGYTGVRKRSRKIEVYDNGIWTILNYKLHYGVEQGILYQKNQQILILSGQTQEGAVLTHLVLDLIEEKSYLAQTINKRPRVLQKGTQIEEYCVQFGDSQFLEKGKLDNLELKQLKNIGDLREFGFADYTFELGNIRRIQNQYIIIQQEEALYKINKKYFNNEQNLTKQQKFKSYIQEIKLSNNQFSGIVIQDNNNIIMFGGVNKFMNKISQDTISIKQNQINILNKMIQGRYAFSYILLNNYIYVAGGRYYGDDEQGILNSCERFDIQNNKWENINNLNEKRCSSFMISHNNKILIAGGFNTQKIRLNSIEIYDIEQNRWDMLGITLQQNLEACQCYFKSNNNKLEFITFGGRSQIDIDQVIKYEIDFDQPIDHQINQYQQLDNLNQQGSLLQIITINQQLFILGQIISVYDQNYKKIVENNTTVQQLQELLQELKIQFIGRYKIID